MGTIAGSLGASPNGRLSTTRDRFLVMLGAWSFVTKLTVRRNASKSSWNVRNLLGPIASMMSWVLPLPVTLNLLVGVAKS